VSVCGQWFIKRKRRLWWAGANCGALAGDNGMAKMASCEGWRGAQYGGSSALLPTGDARDIGVATCGCGAVKGGSWRKGVMATIYRWRLYASTMLLVGRRRRTRRPCILRAISVNRPEGHR